MTDLTRLTRYPDRALSDRAKLDSLLDDVLVCTLSAVLDGQPWAVPVLFARDGDRVLVHGSTGAGMLRHLQEGAAVVLSVHALDGIVVAATAFETGANYRSATLRGSFTAIPEAEKARAMDLFTDRVLPGRSGEVRPNNARELAATLVLSLPIADGGWLYKERMGPADAVDEETPGVWSGVVPLAVRAGTPVPNPDIADGAVLPPSVQARVRRHS